MPHFPTVVLSCASVQKSNSALPWVCASLLQNNKTNLLPLRPHSLLLHFLGQQVVPSVKQLVEEEDEEEGKGGQRALEPRPPSKDDESHSGTDCDQVFLEQGLLCQRLLLGAGSLALPLLQLQPGPLQLL